MDDGRSQTEILRELVMEVGATLAAHMGGTGCRAISARVQQDTESGDTSMSVGFHTAAGTYGIVLSVDMMAEIAERSEEAFTHYLDAVIEQVRCAIMAGPNATGIGRLN